jgi:hypothetical protein
LHIDHEIVEYVATEEAEYEEIVEVYEEEVPVQEGVPEPSKPEYEEIVEVYEEEIPVQEGVPEPSTTNAAYQDAQSKSRCITFILK